MHVKTGWTPRDYPDLYVTDDGETFDLVRDGQAANNEALAFNRILANCKVVADVHNQIFGTAWGFGFTPFSVESIFSADDFQRIEDRCGQLAAALGQPYTGKAWAAGDPIDYRDLNRWEAPFDALRHYEGQTAGTVKVRRCGAFACGDDTAYYRSGG